MSEYKITAKSKSKVGEYKRISDSIIQYYRNIGVQLGDGFENEELQEIFLSNVFEQLVKEICQLAFHQQLSYTLQKLINMANSEQLTNVMRSLITNLENLITHRSGSFVLQSALYKSTEFLTSDEDNVLVKQLHQIGMMLLERSELFTHTHSSHCIRSLIEVMSGVKIDKQIMQGRNASTSSEYHMREHGLYAEFTDLLSAFSVIVLPTTQLNPALLETPQTSTLAQMFLLIFQQKEPKRCKEICESLLDSGCFSELDEEDGCPRILKGSVSSYFCSTFVKVLRKVAFGRLIKEVVVPSFGSIVNNRIANHVVQDIIENVHSELQFGKIIKLVAGKYLQLIKEGKGGVVLKVIKSACKYPSKQEVILSALKGELGCDGEGGNLIVALATHSPKHDLPDRELSHRLQNISYIDAMIMQQLFQFTDTELICSSLEGLPSMHQINFASGKCGSHVYDAYISSTTVSLKHKRVFAEKLQPLYPTLVSDMYGSRVFDGFWSVMTVPMKQNVMVELGKHIAPIVGSRFGKVIAFKVHLQDYVHDRKRFDEWLISENQAKKLQAPYQKRKKTPAPSSEAQEPTASPKKKKKKPVEA